MPSPVGRQISFPSASRFKAKNARKAETALEKLAAALETAENCFRALLAAVEVCSLGQICPMV